MFGNDMFGKLNEMKRVAEESKLRLGNMIIEEEAGNGLVVVTMNGNREIKSIAINTDHTLMQKEDLEDLITVAMERALAKVNQINEQEVMSSAKNFFPGM